MPLKRVLRQRGRSTSITLPKDVVSLLGWGPGTIVVIEIAGPALLIRASRGGPGPGPAVGDTA